MTAAAGDEQEFVKCTWKERVDRGGRKVTASGRNRELQGRARRFAFSFGVRASSGVICRDML